MTKIPTTTTTTTTSASTTQFSILSCFFYPFFSQKRIQKNEKLLSFMWLTITLTISMLFFIQKRLCSNLVVRPLLTLICLRHMAAVTGLYLRNATLSNCFAILILTNLILPLISKGVTAHTFTFINKCEYTVWPGILGSPKLDSTGFELPKGSSRSFQAPTGWSGRFWGRTGCNFDSSGRGSCTTADCGSGQMECNGAGATPPATLAEFTLGTGSQDFYDVSLVDGYNLPMIVEGSGGAGACTTTGCISDLNRSCPNELRTDGGTACKSACEAFGNPEYCCSGAYNSPAACKPSMYSTIFKNACPRSYSYAYDDATSTFTCTGADYTITFCPTFPSLKSASNSSPKGTETTDDSESGPVEAASFASQWLANLAIGDSTTVHPSAAQFAFVVAVSLFVFSSHMR